MATLKGVNRTKADTPESSSSNIMDPGVQEGTLRVMQDTYEASAAAINDAIQMGKQLPKGAYVQEVILTTDALGASVQLAVGDAEDTDRYITATTANTANLVTRLNAIDGRDYKIDETIVSTTDRQVLITVTGAAATGTIKLVVIYSHV